MKKCKLLNEETIKIEKSLGARQKDQSMVSMLSQTSA